MLRDLEPGKKVRFIVFDFDSCFDELGHLDLEVKEFIDMMNTYVEQSVGGRGLHVIAEYCGPPYKTKNANVHRGKGKNSHHALSFNQKIYFPYPH